MKTKIFHGSFFYATFYLPDFSSLLFSVSYFLIFSFQFTPVLLDHSHRKPDNKKVGVLAGCGIGGGAMLKQCKRNRGD